MFKFPMTLGKSKTLTDPLNSAATMVLFIGRCFSVSLVFVERQVNSHLTRDL